MGKATRRRTRKLRRSLKAVLRFGANAKAKHQSRSGRTGKVHAVQLKGRRGGLVPPPEASRDVPVERCGRYTEHAAHVWLGPGMYGREYRCPGARKGAG